MSSSLQLVNVEHSSNAEILRKPAQILTFPLEAEILELIEDMKKKLIEIEGAGLAANQVGFHIQLILYHVTEDILKLREDATEIIPITTLINPSYTPIEAEGQVSDWEGCFSVSVVGKVPRWKRISYQGFTPDGQKIKAEASGFHARVLQHEIDHINGIMITDVLTPDCLQGSAEEMRALRVKEMEERNNQQYHVNKTKD